MMQDDPISWRLDKFQSGKGDRGSIGSMSAAEDTEQRKRELAVIRAAREAVNDLPNAYDRPSSWAKLALLEEEVKALDALTAPQPVDPQTLRLGTAFHFLGTYKLGGAPYRVVGNEQHKQFMASNWAVADFSPGTVVIPLLDDTE